MRFKKERIPWNKGKKGYKARKRTPEEIQNAVDGLKRHYDKVGRISTSNELERKSISYQEWRNQVYKRDKYVCQECGNNRNLHPHHIKSFSNHPGLRYIVDNGITLCEKCHGDIHGIDFTKTIKKKHCIVCGELFKPHKDKQMACSKECGYKFRSSKPNKKKGRKYPHLQRAPIIKCKNCGKEFRGKMKTYRRTPKYCSMDCYLEKRWGYKKESLTGKEAVKLD